VLQDVSHHYGDREVLAVDHLEVGDGEVLGLVGPTGSGKSTLLRLLAGVETASAGRVLFGGHDLGGSGVPLAVRRRVTLMFQRPLLLAGTVRANVEYGPRLRGLGRHPPQAQDVMRRLGLNGLASRRAASLSGGEGQLVALARALALEPQALLLDEPTAHLDPARVSLAEGAVRDFQAQGGATVVWATHNLFQARRVARRVAFLLDGRLVEAAPTEEFFTAPRDGRTAAFLRGEMVW
jgi:tungstate transport system ATP-binding protein